jgi:hypothetical protein
MKLVMTPFAAPVIASFALSGLSLSEARAQCTNVTRGLAINQPDPVECAVPNAYGTCLWAEGAPATTGKELARPVQNPL